MSRHRLAAACLLPLALAAAPTHAGNALYATGFDSGAGWPDSDSAGDLTAVYAVVGGEYLINPLRDETYALALAPVQSASPDMAVEGDVRLAASQATSRAGLACRIGHGLNFYAFTLVASGSLEIVRVEDGVPQPLARTQAGFDPAMGARLRAECQGSTLRLLVEGREVLRAEDDRLSAGGGAGLLSLSPVVAATNAAFDDFVLYALADSAPAQAAANVSGFEAAASAGGSVLSSFEDMAMHADDGAGKPGALRTLFPTGQQRVFVVVDFSTPVHASLRADWYAVRGSDERKLLSGELEATGQGSSVYLAADGNFQAGLYRVEVYANDELLDQREFSVY